MSSLAVLFPCMSPIGTQKSYVSPSVEEIIAINNLGKKYFRIDDQIFALGFLVSEEIVRLINHKRLLFLKFRLFREFKVGNQL